MMEFSRRTFFKGAAAAGAVAATGIDPIIFAAEENFEIVVARRMDISLTPWQFYARAKVRGKDMECSMLSDSPVVTDEIKAAFRAALARA